MGHLRKPKNTSPSIRYSLNSGHRVLFDPALHDQKSLGVVCCFGGKL